MELEEAHLDVGLRKPLARAPVVETAATHRHPQQLLEQLGVDDELARAGAALVREGGAGDAPAIVLVADELVARHEHVGEEHLVELGLAGELHEGLYLDASGTHVDDEIGDAHDPVVVVAPRPVLQGYLRLFHRVEAGHPGEHGVRDLAVRLHRDRVGGRDR